MQTSSASYPAPHFQRRIHSPYKFVTHMSFSVVCQERTYVPDSFLKLPLYLCFSLLFPQVYYDDSDTDAQERQKIFH